MTDRTSLERLDGSRDNGTYSFADGSHRLSSRTRQTRRRHELARPGGARDWRRVVHRIASHRCARRARSPGSRRRQSQQRKAVEYQRSSRIRPDRIHPRGSARSGHRGTLARRGDDRVPSRRRPWRPWLRGSAPGGVRDQPDTRRDAVSRRAQGGRGQSRLRLVRMRVPESLADRSGRGPVSFRGQGRSPVRRRQHVRVGKTDERDDAGRLLPRLRPQVRRRAGTSPCTAIAATRITPSSR